MNTESRNKLMIWAIVALTVLNLTTIATVFYYRSRNVKETADQKVDSIRSETASMRFSGRYFRDQLDLNAEQMERFREFNPAFRQHVRDINFELGNIRRKMLDEMSSSGCDTGRLNTLSDSVGKLHTDLKKLTYRYYLDFKEICNKEQIEKLDILFGDMFATDVQTGHYGPGGRYGRGRGRRSIN